MQAQHTMRKSGTDTLIERETNKKRGTENCSFINQNTNRDTQIPTPIVTNTNKYRGTMRASPVHAK